MRRTVRRIAVRSLRLALLTLLLAAAPLAAFGGDRQAEQGPPVAETPDPTPVRAGFGGVVEVRFSTEDPAAQDALASACGLSGGRRAGLAASPLPPSVRWYTEPADAGAAITCMRGHQAVLRALLPL